MRGPAADPAGAITAIYKAYQTGSDAAPDGRRRLQPPPAATDRRRSQVTPPEGEVGKLDWDVFVDGQDWKISDLNVALVSEAADRAQVSAQFNNLDEPKEILFDLVREDGRWLVDDVQSTKKGRPLDHVESD